VSVTKKMKENNVWMQSCLCDIFGKEENPRH